MARHGCIFLSLIVLNGIGCTSAFQSGVDGRRQTWRSAGRLISPAWSGGRSHSHALPIVSEAARTLPGGLHTNPRRADSRCTVLAARPNVSDEEMEQRKEQLRELLCATKAEIDELVRNNPSVLSRRDIVKSHGPKLEMLQERLGISKKAACRMCLSNKRLLCASLETLESKIQWLQARLNLDKTDLGKVIKRCPTAMISSVEDNLQPSLENIQTGLQMSDKDLTSMIKRTPKLLRKNFSSEKLAVRLSFLRDLLSIKEGDIAKLRKAVLKRPEILFWFEESMLKSQQWMKDRFGLDDARIFKMSTNAPQLLTAKMETLEEKADSLQKELHLHDEELSKMISIKPEIVVNLNMERKVKPKIKYLRRTFQLNNDALREMLLRMPSLLTCSEKTMEKKLNFYVKLIGERAAKKLVVEMPYLIANYSVENCLEPRLEEVRKSGEKIKWDKTTIKRLTTRPDALWEKYGLGDAKGGRPRKKT